MEEKFTVQKEECARPAECLLNGFVRDGLADAGAQIVSVVPYGTFMLGLRRPTVETVGYLLPVPAGTSLDAESICED
jgi:hypothetical protein